MTESNTEHRKPGTKWWSSVFHKKKKKKMVEILTECNARLTTLIEDQSRLISSLTFENGRNDQIIKDYEHKIDKLTDGIQKLEDKSKRDHEFLESQRDKLQSQYYDIQVLTSEKEEWTKMKTSLEQEKRNLDTQVREYQDELLKIGENKTKLEDENSGLKATISSLKDDLVVSSQTLYEETVKNKLLMKDYQLLQGNLTDTKNALDQAAKKIENLQNNLLAVTSDKYKVENELGAINECLKYEVVVLKNKARRKRKKIDKLYRDKQLILQYYRSQEIENITSGNQGELQFKLPSNQFADIPYAEFMKNKVFSLEGQLYRRNQLINELCDVITEFAPDFDLHRTPGLKQYLDSETSLFDENSKDTDRAISTVETGNPNPVNQNDISITTDGSTEDISVSDSVSYSSSVINSTSLDEIDIENENQSAILMEKNFLNKLSVCTNDNNFNF